MRNRPGKGRKSSNDKSQPSGGEKPKLKSIKPFGTLDFILGCITWGVLPIAFVFMLGYFAEPLLGTWILGDPHPRLHHDDRILLDNKIFNVVEVPGKGYGAVAIRDIKAGELIIQERPAILLDSRVPPKDLPDTLAQMDRLTLKAVLDLSHHSLPEHVNTDFENQTDTDRLEMTMAILNANGIGIGENAIGLFPRMARLNHACSSAINTIYSWREKPEGGGELVIRAIKPIKQGEEITVYYMDTRMTRDERRQYLRERYSFTCECAVCSLPDDKSAESDIRLTRMKELSDKFQGYNTGDLNGKEAADIARSILRLEDKEQYFHERAKLAEDMTYVAAAASDFKSAREWAKLSVKWYTITLGSEHPQTRTMSFIYQQPKTHSQWGKSPNEDVGGPGEKYFR